MALVQALVIALAALILAPGYLFYFDITPKLVVVLAGTALAVLWAAFSGVRVSGAARWFRVFSILLLMEIASLALSTGFSVRPELSLFGTNWRRFGSVIQIVVLLFAWLVAVSCAERPERVRTVLRGVVLAGAISAVYGIAQYFGWDPILPATAYRVGEGITTIVRPPGTMGYASYFANWLVVVAFLSSALRDLETSAMWRRLSVAAAVLATAATLLTGTRAAALGLVVGAAILIATKQGRIPRRVWLGAAIGTVAAVAFYFAPPGQQLRARVRWFADDPWGGARLDLWRDSMKMAAQRLPAGYGPEVFTSEFPRFESVHLAQAYPDFAHESPHNIFLDALVAQGVPGLLLLVGLSGVACFAALQAKQPGLIAPLAAAIVTQQFTAFTIPTALIFWVTAALAVAAVAPVAEPRRRVPLMAGSVVIALALVSLAVRFTVADHVLAKVQQQLTRGELAQAAQQYRRYTNVRLPGGSADIWYSRALFAAGARSRILPMRLGALSESNTVAIRATQTVEDPFNAWYNLAVLCGSQNNASCVDRSLRQAIATNPMWFKPHWALAEVLRVSGHLEEAEREAAHAAELDSGKDPEVEHTLREIREQFSGIQHSLLQE